MPKVVLKLENDISTDTIYPGRYMATVLPTETPQFAFADYTEFNTKAKNKEFALGSIIAAESNFGTGSSREQAVSTLSGYGFTVVAKSFARIFLQNAINLGLNCIITPDYEASEGDEIEIEGDKLINKTTGKTYSISPLPKARQVIIDAGGLIAYTRKRLLEK